MKILLITCAEPGERYDDGTSHSRLAQLAMPTVAAATPSGHEITLLDEKVDSFKTLPDADIVGITLHTTLAPHAYDVARRLRERGTFVVLGGPHPTALPQEALQYADAVVIGDAEDTWPKVLADFEKGRNERIYQSSYPSLENLNSPRMDLLRQDVYPTLAVTHATRGCNYRCEFCSVPGIAGQRYRARPPQKVAEEVSKMKGRPIVFWDDNITSDKRYAMDLFEALTPLKRYWVSMVTILFAQDRDLVRKAAESGCVGVFLGIETFSKDNLRSVKKSFNKVHKYQQAVKNLHDFGIHAGAGIIFGFDHDDTSVFEATLQAAEEIKLDSLNLNVLVPFPGTPVHERFKRERRLLTYDWTKYHPTKRVVYKPTKMSEDELIDGLNWANKKYYRPWPNIVRTVRSPFRAWEFSAFVNWHYWKVSKTYDWDHGAEETFENLGLPLPQLEEERLRIVGSA